VYLALTFIMYNLSYIKRFLLLIIAMQILNLGLFAQELPVPVSQNIEEGNIINSVTEYIAEVVCKKKDAFPENNSNEKKHQTHTVKLIDLQLFPFNNGNEKAIVVSDNKRILDRNTALLFRVGDITVPPPKIV